MSKQSYPWFRTSHRCWYVWHEGKQVRLHPDEKEALRLWHLLEAGAWRPADKGPALAAVIDDYLKHCAGRVRPASMEVKRFALSRLRDSLGETPAGSLDPASADSFLGSFPRWGKTTRYLVGCQIKACLRWADRTGRVGRFPLEGWEIPRAPSRGAELAIGAEVHARLLDAASPYLKDILTGLRETGCRPSELFSVTADDFSAGCWVLAEHKTSARRPGKRVIHLSHVAAALTERLAAIHPSGPLFRNSKGGPLNNRVLRTALERLSKRRGVPHVIPYAYRHTFATDLLAAGVPDATVAELMGHSGTKILHQHYSHLCARQRHLKESLGRARP